MVKVVRRNANDLNCQKKKSLIRSLVIDVNIYVELKHAL